MPLLVAVLLSAGCGRLAEPEREISASAEGMPEASDAPMEEMPDDNQGTIKF